MGRRSVLQSRLQSGRKRGTVDRQTDYRPATTLPALLIARPLTRADARSTAAAHPFGPVA